MENTNKTKFVFRLTKNVKNICVCSGGGMFFFLMILLMLVLNLYCLSGLFTSSEYNYFGADGTYSLMLVLLMVGVLIGIFILTPSFLRKNKDNDGSEVSANLRMFSLWLPIFICIMIQTVIFIVCSFLSSHFTISVFVILSVGILLGILAYVWIIFCSALLYVSKLIRWYIAAIFVINLSPIVIYNWCYLIYRTNPIAPNTLQSPTFFLNPFWCSIGIFGGGIPMVVFFVLGLAGIIAVSMLIEKNVHCKVKMSVISTVYKAVMIILLSITFGLLLSSGFLDKTQISVKYVVAFFVCSVVIALILSYFTFRKHKPFLRISLILSLVIAVVLLIACGIPALARKEAYKLPNLEEIASIKLSVGGFGTFTLDKHFEECIDFNEKILKLHEDGLVQKKAYVNNKNALFEKYSEAKIFNYCDNIRFEYTLKNGEYVHRVYSNLGGTEVEKYFIELFRSEAFSYALQQIKTYNARMSQYIANKILSSCSLTDEQAKTVLATYCKELGNAPDSAFYEGCMYIKLPGVYESGGGVIYVPKSFTETRNIMKSYFDLESDN